MKYLTIFILQLVLIHTLSAQKNETFFRTLIYSETLKESRELLIHLPQNYHSEISKKDNYPVVYLLDAENNYQYFTSITDYMSKQPYADIPELIIVGIKNTERTRDFTPTKSFMEDPYQKGNKLFTNSGGSENFFTFLQKELKPYIKKNYRTLDYQILIGHSFSGLATISCLLKHPDYFNAYIANDPSIWWDNAITNQILANTDLSTEAYKNKILYLAQANNTDYNKTWNNDHIEAIKKLDTLFKKNTNTIDYLYKFYPYEQHSSIVIPANHEAIKYIFRGFQTDIRRSADNPEEFIITPYKNISQRLGVTFQPSKHYLQQLKEFAERRKQIQARNLFESFIK
ncbi:alpha/beta hydrolase-fold protein [Riemerella anatipestifer]|nr:alpha/beta hydrolase-fold protein [Riemerella anatipestifer]